MRSLQKTHKEVERKKIRPPAMNDNGKWNQLNDDVNISNYPEFGSSKKREKKGQNKLRNRICIKSKSRLGKYTGGLQRKISLEVKIEYRHIKEKGKENHPEEEQFLSKTLLGSHNQL